jgi:hypothetical protein
MAYPSTAEGNRAWVQDKIRERGLEFETEAEALSVIDARRQLEEL